MKTKNKIALTGSYGNGKTITSFSLSKIMDLPRVHVENIDSLYFEIYGKNKDPKQYSTSELFSLGLARFHSRIKQESKPGFISDGSVFNEIAYGEARAQLMLESQKISFKDFFHREIYQDYRMRLYRTIIDYASTAYDEIYYLRINPASQNISTTHGKFQEYFERSLFKIFQENNIKYKVLDGDVPAFIQGITNDLGISLYDGCRLEEIILDAEKSKELLKEEFQYGK